MVASNLAYNEFENYVSDSNKCIKFKLVTSAKDLEEDFEELDNKSSGGNFNGKVDKNLSKIPHFNPEMSYQFFGDNENIFGYQNLCVKVYYSCAKLNIYLGIKYLNSVTKEQTGGIEPDDVLKIISSKYETKVLYNLNEFSLNLSKETAFVPYGDLVQELSIDCHRKDQQPVKRHFQIYKANSSVPGFVAYHERMQTFLMWFIEAASYIDIDDERWDFFLVYEKLPLDQSLSISSQSNFLYCFVGYATIYRYFAYPQNVRPRISQFLILPPFQRMSLGTKLLETIYDQYNNKLSVDLTVEEPSKDFQRIRDILDCKLCLKLESFSPEKLIQGWSKEMAVEAQKQLKLSAKQARRVYEILRLKITNRSNPEEYRTYRLSIKQRLDAPYNKQITDLEKLRKKKMISETNYATLLKANQVPKEYRIKTLSEQYEEIENDYLEVIDKVSSVCK